MKTMKTTIVSLTLLALWATTAFATPTTGLVLNPADLSNTTQVELMKQRIAEAEELREMSS